MLCFVSLPCPFQASSFQINAEPISPASSLSLLEQAFSADQMLAFAAELMREREYYRAITEYRRFLFTFPHDARRSMTHFRVGLAFYRGMDYGKALEVFGEVAKLYPDTPYGKQAWLWQGECLMRQGKYEAAEDFYDAAKQRLSVAGFGEHATYRHAWALLHQQEWQRAMEQFQSIPIHNSFREPAQQVAEIILDKGNLSRKSPLLAGVLSATLPGSGQLYVGRQGDALLAFVLNGLFVVGIVEALNQDQAAIAGVLSLFEAGWYAGSIYGAVNGAHKYNRHRAETFIQELEGKFRYHPPEFPPTARTFGIGLCLRF